MGVGGSVGCAASMRQAPFLLAAALLASACAPVLTQQSTKSSSAKTMSPSQEAFLRDYAETRRFMSGRPVSPRITPDEKTVLFLRGQPRAPVQTLFAFDVATGQTRELLTPEAILKGGEETLSPEEKARRERMRVSARGFTSYQLSEDGASILVPLSGRLYLVDRASGKSTELKTGEGVIDPRFSSDGKHVGYVRDNDVFRLEVASNTEHRVTQGGTAAKTHGLAEFVAQEEMSRFSGWWWSPDAKAIAYTESDTSGVEQLSIIDVMHPERGAEDYAYPRPGKDNAKVRLGVIPATGGNTVWVKWDAEAYPYLATVVWPKKGPLTVLVQNRTQTEQKLLAVDVASGATRELLTEKDGAWLELEQSFPQWGSGGGAARPGRRARALAGEAGGGPAWLRALPGEGAHALLQRRPQPHGELPVAREGWGRSGGGASGHHGRGRRERRTLQDGRAARRVAREPHLHAAHLRGARGWHPRG